MRRAILRTLATFAAGLAIGAATHAQTPEPAQPVRARPAAAQPAADEAAARAALDRAIEFLRRDQNPNGSWGGPRGAIYTFTGMVWSNPETHRSWTAATTGLAILALHENGAASDGPALRRGLEWLLAHGDVRQPNEWDTMNSWAYIYGLQAVAQTRRASYLDAPTQQQLDRLADRLIARLGQFQSVTGGWGYLEFDTPRTVRPQWATSFSTAAGIVALIEAQRAGYTIDRNVLGQAVRAVERCRLPSGAFTYSVPNAIADPRGLEWIDQVKGSLGRIQVCNEALVLAGREPPVERIESGLSVFFREHRFLDIARNRPIPHEAYYYNSGYFYLFGHYYAARVMQHLPAEQRRPLWPRLRAEVIKTQAPDGSMWDYDMHAYHKPYGTAFAAMTLLRTLPEEPAAQP